MHKHQWQLASEMVDATYALKKNTGGAKEITVRCGAFFCLGKGCNGRAVKSPFTGLIIEIELDYGQISAQ